MHVHDANEWINSSDCDFVCAGMHDDPADPINSVILRYHRDFRAYSHIGCNIPSRRFWFYVSGNLDGFVRI